MHLRFFCMFIWHINFVQPHYFIQLYGRLLVPRILKVCRGNLVHGHFYGDRGPQFPFSYCMLALSTEVWHCMWIAGFATVTSFCRICEQIYLHKSRAYKKLKYKVVLWHRQILHNMHQIDVQDNRSWVSPTQVPCKELYAKVALHPETVHQGLPEVNVHWRQFKGQTVFTKSLIIRIRRQYDKASFDLHIPRVFRESLYEILKVVTWFITFKNSHKSVTNRLLMFW